MIGRLFLLLILTTNLYSMNSKQDAATIVKMIVANSPLFQEFLKEQSKNTHATEQSFSPHTSLEDDQIREQIESSKQKMIESEKKLSQFASQLEALALRDITSLDQLLTTINERKLSKGDRKWLSRLDKKMSNPLLLNTFVGLEEKYHSKQ